MSSAVARAHRAGLATLFIVVVGVTVGVLGVLAVAIFSHNPFKTTTTERQDSVVLARIHDLARFDAATGRFSTIVDQESKSDVLPQWAFGTHVVLAAEGDVDASVDLSRLNDGAVQLSADGKHATVHVPAPTLETPRLDPGSTRVLSRDRGVLDRLGEATTDGDPVHQDRLEQRATDKLSEAAAQSDLQNRAKANTETFLRETLRSSGVDDVTVIFDQPRTSGA